MTRYNRTWHVALAWVVLGVGLARGGVLDALDPAKPVKVFLLGGQSNMRGVGAVADLAVLEPALAGPQSDVIFWDRAGTWQTLQPGLSGDANLFGPEVKLGRVLADAMDNVALVKEAAGGADLAVRWNPDVPGPDYSAFVAKTNTAVGSLVAQGFDVEIVGMFWMQGERDSKFLDKANAYVANFSNFIAKVHAEFALNEPMMPFVFGRISDSLPTEPPPTLPFVYKDTVRAAQGNVAAAHPRTFMVDTDSFTLNSDSVHFDAQGQLDLGQALGQMFLAVPEVVPGDMDGNSLLDVDDVDDFVLALEDRAMFDAAHPGIDADFVGDLDGSGQLGTGDVDNFIAVLNGLPNPGPGADGVSGVPEPSTLGLLAIALLGRWMLAPLRRWA